MRGSPVMANRYLRRWGCRHVEFFAFHSDAVAAFDEFDAVDVELLQERSDADDVAFLALFRQDLADLLAGIGSVVANRSLRPHLFAEIEKGRLREFHHVAVANDVAHWTNSCSSIGLKFSLDCAISRTIRSSSSSNSNSFSARIRRATSNLTRQSTSWRISFPTRYAVGYTVLEANDPLVHYLASDMGPSFQMNTQIEYNNSISNVPPPTGQPFTLGQLNYNFQPWGGNPNNAAAANQITWPSTEPEAFDFSERDPQMFTSDDWDFPTNKLPTVGWIGRVHRGTPWQTVYLKSPDFLRKNINGNGGVIPGTSAWAQWTGDNAVTYNQYFDAINSAPVQDRLLFDLFTTAVNDNATRGQLSVNQSADQYDPVNNPAAGLAAWSAVLGGVVVPGTTNYTVISPAGANGVNSSLGFVVTNINYTRNQFTNLDGLVGTFEHKGDILAAPALTIASPYLPLNAANNDEAYEWLPQQIMSLLKDGGSPRYVIYSYGQTLAPAPNGIFSGSGTLANGVSAFGMVTNYQVTAESATRTVIRIDGLLDANGRPLPPGLQHPHAVIESQNALPPD